MKHSVIGILRDGINDILIKEDDFPSGTFDWWDTPGQDFALIRSYSARINNLTVTVDYKIGVKLDNRVFDVLDEDKKRLISIILYNSYLSMKRITVLKYVNR